MKPWCDARVGYTCLPAYRLHAGQRPARACAARQRAERASNTRRGAILTSMSNAVVIKSSRTEIFEDRIKYLDHVYTRGNVYSVWDRFFGRKFP